MNNQTILHIFEMTVKITFQYQVNHYCSRPSKNYPKIFRSLFRRRLRLSELLLFSLGGNGVATSLDSLSLLEEMVSDGLLMASDFVTLTRGDVVVTILGIFELLLFGEELVEGFLVSYRVVFADEIAGVFVVSDLWALVDLIGDIVDTSVTPPPVAVLADVFSPFLGEEQFPVCSHGGSTTRQSDPTHGRFILSGSIISIAGNLEQR